MKVGKGHFGRLGQQGRQEWVLGAGTLSTPQFLCCTMLCSVRAPPGPCTLPGTDSIPSAGPGGRLQAASGWPVGTQGGQPIPLPGADLFLKVPAMSMQSETHSYLDGAVCSLGIGGLIIVTQGPLIGGELSHS